jgi:L-threonylcarbamoyladenylate synthase
MALLVLLLLSSSRSIRSATSFILSSKERRLQSSKIPLSYFRHCVSFVPLASRDCKKESSNTNLNKFTSVTHPYHQQFPSTNHIVMKSSSSSFATTVPQEDMPGGGVAPHQQQQQQQHDNMNIAAFPHQHHQDTKINHNKVHGHYNKIPLHTQPIQAKMVSSSMVQECGERLRNGDLVAFPTETVYGLGCNALDEHAIVKVFHSKERPLTDPLISHVADPTTAYQLWQATSTSSSSSCSLEAQVLVALTQQFWPGPLTIVAKAAGHVPAILMAQTGYCACRSPSHPLALQLIQAAKVPIAAPSANKFGHVSPTTAKHVWDDLLYENVWILCHDNHNRQYDNDNINNGYDEDKTSHPTNDVSGTTNETTTTNNTVSCEIGVESSVVKISMMNDDDSLTMTMTKGTISLLRQGAVSTQDICDCLQSRDLLQHFDVINNTQKAASDTVPQVAPGQTIRHYSPHIPSYMISQSLYLSSIASDADDDNEASKTITTTSSSRCWLSSAVVIDFGGMLKEWQPHCLAYRDLSATGDSAQATQQVFEILRWAEQVDTARSICFPHLEERQEMMNTQSPIILVNALTLALKDRLTRAASGVVLNSFEEER